MALFAYANSASTHSTRFADNRSSGPMSEMNTTPLIDVLLVLLIMFIIAIPVASHSVTVDLPQPCTSECSALPTDPLTNKITIDASDTVRWNGQPLDGPRLVSTLAATRLMAVEPELQFEPAANASYSSSAQVLRIIKGSGVSNFGFVGNERYRQFDAN